MSVKEETGKKILGKYFLAGIIAAAILFFIFFSVNKNDDGENLHKWSAGMDSMFVKDCYNKYKPQVRDDLIKQESSKEFCRCMLQRIKTRYSEQDMNKVTNSEIKKWDSECRKQLLDSSKKMF